MFVASLLGVGHPASRAEMASTVSLAVQVRDRLQKLGDALIRQDASADTAHDLLKMLLPEKARLAEAAMARGQRQGAEKKWCSEPSAVSEHQDSSDHMVSSDPNALFAKSERMVCTCDPNLFDITSRPNSPSGGSFAEVFSCNLSLCDIASIPNSPSSGSLAKPEDTVSTCDPSDPSLCDIASIPSQDSAQLPGKVCCLNENGSFVEAQECRHAKETQPLAPWAAYLKKRFLHGVSAGGEEVNQLQGVLLNGSLALV